MIDERDNTPQADANSNETKAPDNSVVMPLTHARALDLFDAYFGNHLDRAQTRAFHAHINGCEDCQVRIRTLRASLHVPTTRVNARTSIEDREKFERTIYRNRIMMLAIVVILAMFFFFFRIKRG